MSDFGRNNQPQKALDALVGRSDWIEQVRATVRGVAPFPTSVLIAGPSGTGKELIARAIHEHSPRAEKRFIPVDCASITGTLFASHMFGHVRGAFTGANHDAIGCFRAANGGTIFLDELGELELDLQAKLLRVLQERIVIPVGSHDGVPVDVRIVAATNRDLRKEVAVGRFREDLYYRLNVVSIQTLPLNRRPEDIEVLAQHFLDNYLEEFGLPEKWFSPEALVRIRQHDWPGNVRELENAIERAILFSQGAMIDAAVLPEPAARIELPAHAPAPEETIAPDRHSPVLPFAAAQDEVTWPTADDVLREHICRTLELTGYNQSAAARLLGMDRHQLRRRMAMYGVATPPAKVGRPAFRLLGGIRRAA